MEAREALAGESAQSQTGPAIKGKNVLLIVADQWRGDALRAAGDRNVRTPNIDRLCAEG